MRIASALDTIGLFAPRAGAMLAMLAASIPAPAQEVAEDDGGYSMSWNAGVARFEGKYGLLEETTFDVLNVDARWYLERAEIQLSVPYLSVEGPADVQFVNGQPVVVPGETDERRKESGLGDAVVQGEYYLRPGTESTPWVIGLLRLKLPIGDEEAGLGTGATDVEVGLGLIQQWRGLNWLADVGYTFVGSSSTYELENVARLGVGVAKSFGANDGTSGYVYLENRSNAVETSDDRRSIAVGVEQALDEAKRVRLSASLFFGLTDASEDLGLYLTIGNRY